MNLFELYQRSDPNSQHIRLDVVVFRNPDQMSAEDMERITRVLVERERQRGYHDMDDNDQMPYNYMQWVVSYYPSVGEWEMQRENWQNSFTAGTIDELIQKINMSYQMSLRPTTE